MPLIDISQNTGKASDNSAKTDPSVTPVAAVTVAVPSVPNAQSNQPVQPVVSSPLEVAIGQDIKLDPIQEDLTKVVDMGYGSPAPKQTSNLNFQNSFPAENDNLHSVQEKVSMDNPVNVNNSLNGVREITPIQSENILPTPVTQIPKVETVLSNVQNALPQLPQLSQTSKVETNPTASLNLKSYSLEDILKEGVILGASDIHITVGYRVLIRVNGLLQPIASSVIDLDTIKRYITQLLKDKKNVSFDNLYEVDLTYAFDNRRFRVNIFKQMSAYSIAIRIVPDVIQSLDQLGLPEVVKTFSKFPNGLVLMTGPTGSGKSTTIASILNQINLTESRHIITLEDPVEFVFPKALSMIEQREFGTDFLEWDNALRAILRQDPNIVLIGEMRDKETVSSALRIAETGHLVLATLHTNSAAQTIDRIIDMFPAASQDQIKLQLANVIQAVLSQRLVRTNQNSRKIAVEVMLGTPAVRNSVREAKGVQIDNIIQTGADVGMISLEKSLSKLVKDGHISKETALGTANRVNELEILLR